MILVERDRSAIKNLHDGEVMQVSGAPGQLRSNSNLRWSQAPNGTPLGEKWGWPHKCQIFGNWLPKLAPEPSCVRTTLFWSEPAGSGASPGIGPLSERTPYGGPFLLAPIQLTEQSGGSWSKSDLGQNGLPFRRC